MAAPDAGERQRQSVVCTAVQPRALHGRARHQHGLHGQVSPSCVGARRASHPVRRRLGLRAPTHGPALAASELPSNSAFVCLVEIGLLTKINSIWLTEISGIWLTEIQFTVCTVLICFSVILAICVCQCIKWFLID